MPRTLDATLEAAMDSGQYQPYFLLTVREVGHDVIRTVEPVKFKLSGIEMEATFVSQTETVYSGFGYPHELEFKLTRGVAINGINYTIDSSWYYGTDDLWDGTFETIKASMLPNTHATVNGDDDYETVIGAVCAEYGKTAVFKDPAAAWLAYQYLGDGKQVILNRGKDFIKQVRQKFVIYACDNGDDEILFDSVARAPLTAPADHTLELAGFEANIDLVHFRRFLSRDEGSSVEYSGETTAPLWNLGFVHSSAAHPPLTTSQYVKTKPMALHLKYLSFDLITLNFDPNYPDTYTAITKMRTWVEEEFNYEFPELGWRVTLSSFDWGGGTEGGLLPGTIEAAAPYTPLNTSNFAGILDENDNNIQAAMETIDDHGHTAAEIGSTPNDGWIADANTWTYSSVDDPTGVVTVNANLTGVLAIGDKIRFVNGGNTIYGKVSATPTFSSPNTTIKFLHEIDPSDNQAKYLLANSAITVPYYSHVQNPFGFPTPDKWRIRVTDTTLRTQASPASGTWYNLGSISISIPIGMWKAGYTALATADRASGNLDINLSLSTSNSSVSDASMNRKIASRATQTYLECSMAAESLITLTSKTTYYIITMTAQSSVANIYNNNAAQTLVLYLEFAL